MPTITIDHHPTDADIRGIEAEKDCKVVSAAPMNDCQKCNNNPRAKKTCDACNGTGRVKVYYVITYKVNETKSVGKGKPNVKQQSSLY